MIRARSGDLFILGLDAENLRRLQAKEPILVPLRELGGPAVRVLILYGGETPAEVAQTIGESAGASPEEVARMVAFAAAPVRPDETRVLPPTPAKKGQPS